MPGGPSAITDGSGVTSTQAAGKDTLRFQGLPAVAAVRWGVAGRLAWARSFTISGPALVAAVVLYLTCEVLVLVG